MKNQRIIYGIVGLFLVVLTASQCKMIVMKMAHLHKPRIETPSSIKKRLVKMEVDTSYVYGIDTGKYMEVLKSGAPSSLIFNRKGELIEKALRAKLAKRK